MMLKVSRLPPYAWAWWEPKKATRREAFVSFSIIRSWAFWAPERAREELIGKVLDCQNPSESVVGEVTRTESLTRDLESCQEGEKLMLSANSWHVEVHWVHQSSPVQWADVERWLCARLRLRFNYWLVNTTNCDEYRSNFPVFSELPVNYWALKAHSTSEAEHLPRHTLTCVTLAGLYWQSEKSLNFPL